MIESPQIASLSPFFSKSPIDWTTNPDMKVTYQELIAFRNSSEALKQGTINTYTNGNIVAFKRIHLTEEVLVLVNTRNSTIDYTLDGTVANTSWFDPLDNNAVVNLGTQVSMSPYSYMILKN